MRRALSWTFLLAALSVHAKSPEAPPPAPSLNEIAGRVQSVDLGEGSFRILTESGYQVTFTFDRETAFKGIGIPKSIEDLKYQELVTVRYQGKDLRAREIEKRSLVSVP